MFYFELQKYVHQNINKKTGTISGAPIVASDSVTYVVTANGFHSNEINLPPSTLFIFGMGCTLI
jgi:hypothetical protein